MTCGNCLAKIRPHLDDDPNIKSWEADLADPRKLLRVDLEEDTDPATIARLIERAGFEATRVENSTRTVHPIERSNDQTRIAQADNKKSNFTWTTYKPLLLVVGYVIGASLLFESSREIWQWNRVMTHFMGFFFLGFAFFKLLDISKFADAFASYDLIARRSRIYALAYPWIELFLGFLFVTRSMLLYANIATAIILSVGLVGVVAAVRKKQAIRCACLGTAFNLPMSVVTIIENSVMIVMSLWMLVLMTSH